MAATTQTTAATPSGVSSPYTTYTGPLPNAGAYGVYQAQALQAYQDSLAQIQNQQSSLLSQSGLTGRAFNPQTGMVSSLAVSANDPTGAYQQMMQSLGGNQAAMDAGTTQANLGFHGALADSLRNQGSLASQNAMTGWGQSVQQSLEGLQAEQQQAYDSYQQQLAQTLLNNIQAAIASGAYNPANVTPKK